MRTGPLLAIQSLAFVAAGGATLRARVEHGARWSRAILAAGLAAGAMMHVVALIERGWGAHDGQPIAFRAFWASLAIFDPLAAVLLTARPRAGIALTIVILAADVGINSVAFRDLSPAENWPLWCQCIFGLFAVCTAPAVWRSAATRPSASTPPTSS
jgi:hypothetical protein